MDGESEFPSGPMSIRAFARARGVSHVAVLNALRGGRLGAGAQDGKIVNAAEADRQWARRTDLSKAPGAVKEREGKRARGRSSEEAPPAAEDLSLSEESAREKKWRAKEAELRYRQRAGELVEAREVERHLVEEYGRARTKLLGICSRARQAMTHLRDSDFTLLESLIREALEELATEGQQEAVLERAG